MSSLPPSGAPRDPRALPARARYERVKAALDLKWRRRAPSPERMMREAADALWDAFGGDPWTWCGFWTLRPDGEGLLPGPGREGPPPPRGLEGLVGQAARASGVVLGEDAGAPALAAAVAGPEGRVWAVFLARAAGPFGEVDARWVDQVLKGLRAAGAARGSED